MTYYLKNWNIFEKFPFFSDITIIISSLRTGNNMIDVWVAGNASVTEERVNAIGYLLGPVHVRRGFATMRRVGFFVQKSVVYLIFTFQDHSQ